MLLNFVLRHCVCTIAYRDFMARDFTYFIEILWLRIHIWPISSLLGSANHTAYGVNVCALKCVK